MRFGYWISWKVGASESGIIMRGDGHYNPSHSPKYEQKCTRAGWVPTAAHWASYVPRPERIRGACPDADRKEFEFTKWQRVEEVGRGSCNWKVACSRQTTKRGTARRDVAVVHDMLDIVACGEIQFYM